MHEKTALLIVDVQKGFVNDQCHIIPSVVEALQNDFDYIAACRFYNPPNSPFRSQMGWHKVEKDSAEFELAFTPKESALVYDKPGYSGYTPELESWLKSNNIDKVMVCGINTEVCVLHTATDLFLNDWHTVVIDKACGSTKGSEYHNAGLLAIKHCIGDKSII